MPQQPPQKPRWLKKRLPIGPEYERVKELIGKDRLHTVCQEAKCPNMWECFSQQTATFLIMGSRCTRDCRFCSVAQGPVGPPDAAEPDRVAAAARQMGLRYVVITSVTRDDLADGGAAFFAETIAAVKRRIPSARVEVLIPDLQGNVQALQAVLNAHPDVLNHNIETVPRLYATVRPQARYRRSLQLLSRVKKYAPGMPIKSGLMLGLGESSEEIRSTLQDLVDAGCRILTLGQYLQPSKAHLPVKRFVSPAEFENWKDSALEMGFCEVASGPFVRSSYHAKELYQAVGHLILNRNAEV
jgi:lipoic acid synthetase